MFQISAQEVQAISQYLASTLTISQTQIAENVMKAITANPVRDEEKVEE